MMAEWQGHQNGSKQKSGRLKKVVTSVVMCLVVVFGSKLVARHTAFQEAIQEVERESLSEGAPTGFMGAKWLMSISQAKSVLPNATKVAADTLRVEGTVFERPAAIRLSFNNNFFTHVMIYFKGEKTENTYQKTQALLVQEYGSFTEPARTSEYALASEKTIGRVRIKHLLYEQSGKPIEQVLIFRSKG